MSVHFKDQSGGLAPVTEGDPLLPSTTVGSSPSAENDGERNDKDRRRSSRGKGSVRRTSSRRGRAAFRARVQRKNDGAVLSTALNMPGAKSMAGEVLMGAFPNKNGGANSRSFVYSMLNPLSHQWQAVLFKRFISLVIVLDSLVYILSTDELLVEQYSLDSVFYVIEGIASCIYLVEYIARMATCIESTRFKRFGPLFGRIRYAFTIHAVIDAFATFPFFLEILLGISLPTLTYLRFFRLLRLLRSEGYVRAIDAVYRVIYYNREILYVAVLVCVLLVAVTAVLLYYCRPRPSEDIGEEDIDPNFNNIVSTMYLSTMMLTGQGGPEGNLPWYTTAVVVLTAIFSVAMFAIPASMLTWGFEAEAERCAKQALRRSMKRKGGQVDHSTSSDSYSDDDDSSSSDADSSSYDTDREYQMIIAGEEESGPETTVKEDAASNFVATAQQLQQEIKRISTLPVISSQLQSIGSSGNSGNIERKGHHHSGTTNSMLLERIVKLETKSDATNKKLDQIIQLLNAQQSQQSM